jgi:U3 small nucleolar RNA-associated protein 10
VKDRSPETAQTSPQTIAQYSSLASKIASLLDGPSEDPSPSTKQAALAALEAIAGRFGAETPETLGSAVGAVLANAEPPKTPKCSKKAKGLAEGTVNSAVASVAVRCAATICAALGPRALPQLPGVLETVLGCAQRQLVAQNGSGLSEEQLDLLVVCISAIEKLVSELGAFLSPYLGQVLDLVLLQPAVLTSAAAERAAAVRALLPEKLPPRLLLDPVIKAYDRALALGPQSEQALASLFELVGALNSKLDKQGVAAHHKTVFDFLLRAFDLRRRPPVGVPSLAVGESVEPALIHAFVALVVKLSENTFKPLFLRTLEWAETEYLPPDTSGSEASSSDAMTSKGSLARNAFLYGLVGALTEKLRSVFVPYFKYLMEGIVSHLGRPVGQGPEGGEAENVGFRPKKKKKKSGKEAGVGEGSKLTPEQWELRQLVTSALQKCFQYDTVGFLEPGRFQKLLPSLVAQLRVEVPEGVQDGTLSASADETLVSALGHMALAARSDALWRPLNRDVLMATRSGDEGSGSVRPKMLALSVVDFLVDRLREEYLILLPETIPFLSELLEDTDLTVVAKSQGVVKKLEDLSGENLADYF